MATILPILDIIEIGRASTYLSANYTSKRSALFGGSVVKPTPPVQIAWVTDALDWGNEGGAQTDASLRSTANYAFWLYGLFQLQAQNIISGPGGGSVAPTPSGGASVNDLDFIVSASSYIATGESSVTFDGTGGMPDLRGYDVDFARNGTVQYTTPQAGGALYYAWNRVTGVFQLLSTDPLVDPAALVGESFRIMPDATGGTSSSTVSTWRRLVITSASFEPDEVTCNLATIVGSEYTLTVIGFNQEPQFAGTFFDYTAGGFEIIWPGFLASNFGNIIIDKID